MPDWFFPLLGVLVSIVLALLGCIGTMIYWGATVKSQVSSLDRHLIELSVNLKAEITKREAEITDERKAREKEISKVWQRIDELREVIATKLHG